MRNLPLVAFACLVPAIVFVPGASAQIPPGSTASNVRVVGYSEVDGRPPFKLSIRQANGRWYLYAGHLWHRGWTILDVTDPAKPSVANFIHGPANTWTIQMEIGGDKMITALEKIGQGWGGDDAKPNDEGALVWSLADPVRPKRLGQYKTGGTGTHRNFYSGGRFMHLAAGMPGYNGNIYVIVDISDPAKPVEVGRWWATSRCTDRPTSRARSRISPTDRRASSSSTSPTSRIRNWSASFPTRRLSSASSACTASCRSPPARSQW